MTNTTVSGNSAEFQGGGISNGGTMALTNTTVSGNSAPMIAGGGILNNGTLTLINTTVSGNSSGWGGGIRNYGTATLTNSIVLGNQGHEIEGTVTENGPNIIGGNSADVFAETVEIDPRYGDEFDAGLLADNGGAVPTIALKNDSANPALDAGQDDRLDESVAGIDLNGDGDMDDVIDTDARGDGFARMADLPDVANNGANTVDLGAFEVQAEDPGGPIHSGGGHLQSGGCLQLQCLRYLRQIDSESRAAGSGSEGNDRGYRSL